MVDLTDLQAQDCFKLSIEQNKMPRYLYKYTSIDSCLHIINDGTVYFNSYKIFNDPFECKANLDTKNTIQEWMSFLLTNKVPLPQAKTIAARMVKDPKTACHTIEQSVMAVQDSTGFLCLTTKNDNLLMWAHYASNHTGCCVKFDLLNDVDLFCKIQPVIYDNNYLTYNYLRDNGGALRAICHKSTDWAYEEEYRVFSMNNIGPIPLQPGTVKEIYLGCRIDPKDKQNIIQAIGATTKQLAIIAYQTEPDSKSYKLNFIRI